MTRAKTAGVCARPMCDRKTVNYGYCTLHKRYYRAVGYVDADVFYDRVRLLQQLGHSLESLAAVSGLSRSVFTNRPIKTVRAETMRRLFEVPLPAMWADGGGYVPSLGTHRRLQALRAVGYTPNHIAAELGITKQAVQQWANHPQVRATTALKVDELFQRLHMIPGPSKRSRQYAKRMGWPPPLAWNEGEIDDPDAQPHTGEATVHRFRDRYQELREIGVTSEERIAARLGITRDSLDRQLWRNGLRSAS